MYVKDFEKTALIYRDRHISYREVIGSIEAFSGILKIDRGDRVLIFSENRPEWIYAFFAVWERSGTVVPIDFLSTPEEVAYILGDATPKLVFTSNHNKEILLQSLDMAGHRPDIIVFEEIDLRSETHSKTREANKNRNDTAVILYTSGTTGRPKGVMLTHANLDSNVYGIGRLNLVSKKDSIISMLPFHHSYPLMVTVLLPLFLGITIVMVDKISSEEILKTLKDYKITIFMGVPRVFELLHRAIFEEINRSFLARFLFFLSKKINRPAFGRMVFKSVHKALGGNIRYLVSGGARLDREVITDFSVLGLPVIEGYGLTETSPIVAFNPPAGVRIGSVGLPIEGVEVRTEDGEILVRGPNVMKGYLHQAEKTREVLRDGWLYSGDLGYIDRDGYVYITGRKKDIIVLPSGKNINPEDIEGQIQKISDLVKEIAIVEREGHLLALIYPDFETLASRKITNIQEEFKWDVIDRYNIQAPSFKKVSGFKIVETEFPKTRLGKIKRFLLDSSIEETKTRPSELSEPKGEVYSVLREYLKGISGRDVFPDAHIELDLGLDSLDKVELLSFIEGSFGLVISEEELSKLLILRKLSEYIEREKTQIRDRETGWKDVLMEDIEIHISESPYLLVAMWCLIRPLFRLYFSLDVRGIENIPQPPYIMAPNHQSYLDGFLILASLQLRQIDGMYFVATEDLFRSKLRKYIARQAHILTLDVNRNLRDSLRKSAMLLKEKRVVVIFPEGARTRDGKLMSFKKTFAILSKELDVPVVPICIEGAYKSFPIGAMFPRPHKIKVTFLPAIYPDAMGYQEIANTTREAIKKCMGTV